MALSAAVSHVGVNARGLAHTKTEGRLLFHVTRRTRRMQLIWPPSTRPPTPPVQLTQSRAEEFYGEHHGKEFFPKLVAFMTSGPIWALVLAKPGAILAWRALMGPTNVFTAREKQPKW